MMKAIKRHILFLCITVTSFGYAQFYVGEHTRIGIQTDVISQEYENIINSDLLGSGTLVFNSTKNQYLSSLNNSSIPAIEIKNTASFDIYSSIYIKGDMRISSRFLNLHQPVFVGGSLDLYSHTIVAGLDLIFTAAEYKAQPLSLPYQHLDFNCSTKQLPVNPYTKPLQYKNYTLKGKNLFYTEATASIITIAIPTPPPEYKIRPFLP